DWVFILYAIYIPLAILTYLLEVFAILQYRRDHFKSSFFTMFCVLAVVNICACFTGSFVFRLNLYPIINQFYDDLRTNSVWLTAAYSSAYYLNVLSEFLGMLLALNRFSALYFPVLHDRVWSKACFVGISACAIIAVAPVWFLFDDPARFILMRDRSVTYKQNSIWYNMVIVTFICNGLSSLLYGACIVRLCRITGARHATAERNLLLVGFCSMICSIPYMAGMLFFYLNLSIEGVRPNVEIMKFNTYQLPWLTDLKYLPPAPLLLITTKSIRQMIRR
ncbi:hypothetical protein PENTCL1PPCAC_20365, partial [Pristionchus entomophagus]